MDENLDIDHKWLTLICTHCGYEKKVSVPCGDRFCRTCNAGRQARTIRRISWLIKQSKSRDRQTLKFVTLTIPHSRTVFDGTRKLISSFRKLRNRQGWKKRLYGGLYVIEVKGSPAAWHVHMHIVVIGYRYPQKQLLRDWRRIVGRGGAHIEAVHTPNTIHNELGKYLSKPSVHPDFISIVSKGLKGARLFQPFGTWHSVNRRYPKPVKHCPDCGKDALEILDFMPEFYSPCAHSP